ncbi:MAG: UDP-3-O-(3-hydroxymyristoyl)glucosamine N-acyltransferase [Burkholderiales bacterium]|nr:UDP-3-O-(3-hydroxymyristoyl)glucosamine N-acyltransferase [Burkholderiales bacterium]
MKFKSVCLSDLIKEFGGKAVCFFEPPQNQQLETERLILEGFSTLANAKPGNLGFLANPKYRSQVQASLATAVLVTETEFSNLQALGAAAFANPAMVAWVVTNPYIYYARVQQWWVEVSSPRTAGGRHPSAVIHAEASVDDSAQIGANAVIGSGARIGPKSIIGAGCVIGENVVIGAGCLIHPNVTVYHDCSLGDRVILHSGVVIGADGFGFAPEKGQWIKIPQVGAVIVGDDVEIGANTCIDRGALDDTLIGAGCKLDNLIQIGHNVEIGAQTAIAGCTGVAGTAKIGARCAIGGSANILGHLSIADGTTISPCTTVISSIAESGVYSGIFPMDSHKNWERNAAVLRNATELRTRIRALEKNQKTNTLSDS